MAIDRAQVEKVAYLARLNLTEAELQKMTIELGKIVAMVDQMSEIDTEGVEPLNHPLEFFNVLADDAIGTSLSRDQALANAPSADEECFRVPAVFN